jgi:hypothetical protein
MNEFIKIRVPFYKRITNGGTDGLVTFYLKEMPKYLPQSVGSKVIITHTDIPDSSGLKTKLNNLSTNTVVGYFQQVDENVSPDSIFQSDGYSIFFVAQYEDLSFSTNQFAGNCRGYIEYYVAPSALNILKPIETSVIVSEKIPFNDEEGYIKLENNAPAPGITETECYKCMFIDREDKETIFSSLLKSLNVPITAEEKKKYTRSPLGYLQPSSIKTDIIQNGYYYDWIEYTGGTQPSANLIVHPTTGFTGEYFNTVLETISIDKSHNISGTPIDNRLYFVMEIPNKKYGEIIDGKTIHIQLNSVERYDIYGTYNKKNLTTTNLDNILSEIDLSVKDIGSPVTLNNGDYESNIVLLFATGNTGTDWAKGYSDIKNGDKVFNPTNQIKETYDYYADRCVGYAVLDKGFIVITDKTIVHNLFESNFGGTINEPTITFPATGTGTSTGGCITYENTDFIVTKDTNNNNIEWNNTQFQIINDNDFIEYFSYNTEKSLNIVCLASCDEFYKSTNDTAKELLNLSANADVADFKTDDLNLHPIMISQIGIHDSDGNLLAICKPNQPIKKYWHDILSFNIKIRI